MRIILSSTSSVPMYEQIKTQVRNAVHAGELAEGALLPSLRQLALELRVSVITITRAYNDLVAEGLVRNEHGRGFVVREVDADLAGTALAGRVESATNELVQAARAAHMSINDIRKKVEDAWNRT
ncbi:MULTISPECIES: GntR family transcriptional regulator [unclassified Curtobacterium]|uniref:GntR family transcriptional regulator n=1 Tax=unclassified Curtobacterium TaxID=257496 RepID=UPI00285DA1D9|nr:GntR family transcriptional regulator [Curtobacterium sp. 320]MDR6573580.1 GntR family transcriptional regulator [Curtobacterium sp. 320]